MLRYKLRTLLILLAILPPLLWVGWIVWEWCEFGARGLVDIEPTGGSMKSHP